MRKEDIALTLGVIVFILTAFVLTVLLKYNELISFAVASAAGIVTGMIVSKLGG